MMLRASQYGSPFRNCSNQEVEDLLEHMFLQVSLEDLLETLDSQHVKTRRMRGHAFLLHCEVVTVLRVAEMNRTRGLAPTSEMVCHIFDEALLSCPVEWRGALRRGRSWDQNRIFAHRLRIRWGGRMGSLEMGGIDSVVVLREKVSETKAFG